MSADRDMPVRRARPGLLERLPGHLFFSEFREVARSKSGRREILRHATLAFLFGAAAALVSHGHLLGS